jgi:hypothetical protein
VCRWWRAVARDDSLWRPLCRSRWPGTNSMHPPKKVLTSKTTADKYTGKQDVDWIAEFHKRQTGTRCPNASSTCQNLMMTVMILPQTWCSTWTRMCSPGTIYAASLEGASCVSRCFILFVSFILNDSRLKQWSGLSKQTGKAVAIKESNIEDSARSAYSRFKWVLRQCSLWWSSS